MLKDYKQYWQQNIDRLNKSQSEIVRLLANRYTAKKWNDKPVSQQQTQAIMDAIQWTPIKSMAHPYKVWAITDSENGKSIKQMIYDEVAIAEPLTNSISTERRRISGEKIVKNKQVLAPLLLLFWSYDYGKSAGYEYDEEQMEIIEDQINGSYEGHSRDPIAMAGMNAVLTAESMGLQTAYCKCFNDAHQQLFDRVGISNHNYKGLELMICIGHSDDKVADVKGDNIAKSKTRVDLFEQF
tara:strand:- start:306 stop:1025 length:720 start_codon:yes stop_codon:yes gene_type:complete